MTPAWDPKRRFFWKYFGELSRMISGKLSRKFSGTSSGSSPGSSAGSFPRSSPGSSPGNSPGNFPGSSPSSPGNSQKALRKLSRASQETFWDHQHLQGMRTALNTIYWCPSAAECKKCIYFWISRGVFEGRCHQVPKITIQNGPRQIRRNTKGVMGSSNPTPLEPLQINLFGEQWFWIVL